MRLEEAKEFLTKWEGVLIAIENEPFTGLSYNVPGWKCKKCGTQYGCIGPPPSECWKCNNAVKK